MPSSARSQPLTGGRLAAVVGGAATLLLASVLLLAGTGLLWADSSFWAASTEGSGERTLSWDVMDGSWSVVVMNADGSPGVDVRVSAGASVPFLDDLAWGVSIASVLLGIAGAMLIVLGVRRRRRPSSPAGSAWAA